MFQMKKHTPFLRLTSKKELEEVEILKNSR